MMMMNKIDVTTADTFLDQPAAEITEPPVGGGGGKGQGKP